MLESVVCVLQMYQVSKSCHDIYLGNLEDITLELPGKLSLPIFQMKIL